MKIEYYMPTYDHLMWDRGSSTIEVRNIKNFDSNSKAKPPTANTMKKPLQSSSSSNNNVNKTNNKVGRRSSRSAVRRRVSCCSQSQLISKPLWTCFSMLGMRRCFRLLKKTNSAYRDTISHFYPNEPYVALTIDDGLSRGGSATSMTPEVLALLKKYNAHATFFVCTDYVQDQEDSVQALLDQGHELGNHLKEDKLWYYPKLSQEEFQSEMQAANRILDDLEARHGSPTTTTTTTKTRWFRAPQGIINKKMRQAIAQEGETTKHVLGDCYCDDWCFAQDADPLFHNDDDDNDNEEDKTKADQKLQNQREKAMKQVAKLMLRQVKVGSVAILHMPEKGFREGNLLALEFFLRGVQERGFRCVNLSEMQATSLKAEDTRLYDSDDSDSERNINTNKE